MKFDIDRVMVWVKTFDFFRGSGSEGERHAADLLSAHLEQGGWRVNRPATKTGCRLSTLVMILLLTLVLEEFFLWKALQASFPALSRLARASILLAIFVALGVLLRLAVGRHGVQVARERFAAWRSPRDKLHLMNLVADRPGPGDRPVRVFILTHLDTPLRLAEWEDVTWYVGLAVLIVLSVLNTPRVLTAWLLALTATVALFFQARYWLRLGRPSAGDNRTGLAVLAELPQILPARMHERMEIRLAAVGGSALGQLGSMTLADEIRRGLNAKPTLIINLDAPGLGPRLRVVGKGKGAAVAHAAASDLWIPHRVSRWSFCPLDHRPFQLNRIAAVSLAGDRNGTRIDLANLAATAQLVVEISLRWARMESEAAAAASAAAHQAETGGPESAERSSQNPG